MTGDWQTRMMAPIYKKEEPQKRRTTPLSHTGDWIGHFVR